jgi:signal transduction histidine kinase
MAPEARAGSLPGYLWRFLRAVLPPLVLAGLVVLAMLEPIRWWLHGEETYDQEAIKEWVREGRNVKTLPDLVREYLDLATRRLQLHGLPSAQAAAATGSVGQASPERELRDVDKLLKVKRAEILEYLKALGNPTKMYAGQLPLFPMIYRITVKFAGQLELPPIVWDSELPRQKFRELPPEPILQDRAWVQVQYHLHAYQQRQLKERQETARRLWLSGLGIFFTLLGIAWIYLAQRRERARQRHQLLAQQKLNEADKLRLEEELRRQEAERKHQEVERQNLELKSQLFANIGIMAGSYAHNIKNLLVRPNDLLRRCLEENPADQAHLLREVRQTLGTVTERLQQILQTVRRDPSKVERVRLDLNVLAQDMYKTWVDLGLEKWKLVLELDRASEPLWIEGDLSHLQQALENLLFNARDATFEMRNYLREQARQPGADGNLDPERRQALIAAAGWKGRVVIRTRRAGDHVILEVVDNGVGMTEEVRRRCRETHFSTKRNNALFAGISAGMGLGLSFVSVILEHHQADLEIESEPLRGATFRVIFPAAASV